MRGGDGTVPSIDRDRLLRLAMTYFAAPDAGKATLPKFIEDLGADDIVDRYGNADGLFAAAVELGTRDLREAVAAIATSPESPADRLHVMIRRLGSPTDDERTALYGVFKEVLVGSPRATLAFETCLGEVYEHLMAVIGESQIRGEIAPLPPRSVLTVLLCGVLLPQLIGVGSAEGDLQGVHVRCDDDDQYDVATKPRSALLAASLQAVFTGLIAAGQGARS